MYTTGFMTKCHMGSQANQPSKFCSKLTSIIYLFRFTNRHNTINIQNTIIIYGCCWIPADVHHVAMHGVQFAMAYQLFAVHDKRHILHLLTNKSEIKQKYVGRWTH